MNPPADHRPSYYRTSGLASVIILTIPFFPPLLTTTVLLGLQRWVAIRQLRRGASFKTCMSVTWARDYPAIWLFCDCRPLIGFSRREPRRRSPVPNQPPCLPRWRAIIFTAWVFHLGHTMRETLLASTRYRSMQGTSSERHIFGSSCPPTFSAFRIVAPVPPRHGHPEALNALFLQSDEMVKYRFGPPCYRPFTLMIVKPATVM